MPLSPPSTLHRVSVGLLPLCIPRCPPRGLGLHAGIAARTAPSAYRSAGPRRCAHCAETVAGGCRFPHRKLYAGSLWGSCRISSLAVLPVGSDCTPGSPQGLRLRPAAARARPGAPGPSPAAAAFPTANPTRGLCGATAAAHPSLSSSWARTARRDRRKDCASDCRSAVPRRRAGTVAGGCRFPHRQPSKGPPWGYCRIASLAVLPVGSDCTPGSQQG